MREIEIKAKLSDPRVIEKRLQELGCVFSAPITQDDRVYVERAGSLEEFLSNPNFLRIRTTEDAVIFTLKHHENRAASKTEMPIEHEIIVGSSSELTAMLTLLGFTEALRIRKTRRTGHVDGFEICLDDVEELGAFIEVEKLAEHDVDVLAIQNGIRTFMESLGISEEAFAVERYDIQLLEKRFSRA